MERNASRAAYTVLGGAVAIVLIYALELGWKVKLPSEVAGAIGTICSTIAGMFVSKLGGE